jgi:hypothetical protein
LGGWYKNSGERQPAPSSSSGTTLPYNAHNSGIPKTVDLYLLYNIYFIVSLGKRTFYFLTYLAYMREYSDGEETDLEILMESHVLSPLP